MRVCYEPEAQFLTVFWQEPRAAQVATELDDGVILINDSHTGEPIGMELLSHQPGDPRFDTVSVEIGRQPATSTAPA